MTIEWYCSSSTPSGAVTWARRAKALRWSGSCMMPKQSSTTSACDVAVVNPRSASSGIQVPPCGLPNSRTVSPRSQPAAATRVDRVLGLVLQRLRLHATRLVGDRVVVGQLSQATGVAHVHGQRVRCLVGAHRIRCEREVVGRRHFPEIQYPTQVRFRRILCTRSWQHYPVRIETTDLADVLVLIPQPFRDDRGLFTRTFDADIFDDYLGAPGTSASFVQDSQSRSAKGVIRGMHGRSGRGEAKLVRCANGAVHDVLVDIRRDSPTFGKQQAFLLDDNDFRHLYVPPGLPARLSGADRDRRRVLSDRSSARSRPRTWPSRTTTRILRSIGRCRSRRSRARDASAGSWAELLTHLS